MSSIGFNSVYGNAALVVVTVDASKFNSSEQREKTINHVRKLTSHIKVPVAIIDSSTTSIQAFTDDQLKELGLKRIQE